MDVDLDAYIKEKGIGFRGRRGGARGGQNRGRGGNQGRGSNRGGGLGGNFSGGMVQRRQPMSGGMFTNRSMGPSLDISGGSTLHIANLDFGVNNQDIGELFGEFGPIRRFAVHFDQMGRSLGTAEVHYVDNRDAMRALTKYNGVPLDGRPMKIQISGGLARGPAMAAATMRSGASFGAPRGGNNRRGGRGAGPGRGGNRQSGVPSKEDLDAELEGLGPNRGGNRGGSGGGPKGGNKKGELSKEDLDAELDSIKETSS